MCWSRAAPAQRAISDGAPPHLVFVADVERLIHTRGDPEPGLHDRETQKSSFFIDAGLIAENVCIYASAAGLGAWFHNCDRAALALTVSSAIARDRGTESREDL